ncbi:MAG: hypothetical protein M3Y07_15680 [Acidobacteriota bacterium]|nr:hypothetical protein [Acidobacteriota bacterium]
MDHGSVFFLSSGAAATIIAKAPSWIPLVLALVVAGAKAYLMALNLDSRISTMAKLHAAWTRIANEYSRLWNHTYDDNAENHFSDIIQMENEPSELAIAGARNDQELLGKWRERVFALYHLTN